MHHTPSHRLSSATATTPSGLPLLTPSKLPAQSPAKLMQSPHNKQSQHIQQLNETFIVLDELIHEFKNSADECALLSRLLSSRRVFEHELQQKQQEMKELITSISHEIHELASRTAESPVAHLRTQQQLQQQQKASIQTQIQNMLNEIKLLEDKGMDLEKQKQMLLQQKEQTEKTAKQKLPVIAGTMGLYRNFSSIAWDYDAPETRVKGTFHFDLSGEMKSFNFSKADMTPVELADQLWGMMAQNQTNVKAS